MPADRNGTVAVETRLRHVPPAELAVLNDVDDLACFVCGQPMPPAEANAMCWGVPGRGVAHGDCYEPSDEEEPSA